MRRSRLGQDGENVFQIVRAKRTEAQAKGVKLIDLSIGEPRGPALLSARQAAAAAVMSEDEAMHAYQYNASPGVPHFTERFIQAHVHRAFTLTKWITYPFPVSSPYSVWCPWPVAAPSSASPLLRRPAQGTPPCGLVRLSSACGALRPAATSRQCVPLCSRRYCPRH